MNTKLKRMIIGATLAATLSAGGAYLHSKVKAETEVYICTGPQSKRYHKTENCMGLGRCSREVKKVKLSEAEDDGRTPCGYCY